MSSGESICVGRNPSLVPLPPSIPLSSEYTRLLGSGEPRPLLQETDGPGGWGTVPPSTGETLF